MYNYDEIIFKTSLGNIQLASKNKEIVSIQFTTKKVKQCNLALLNKTKKQIEEYIVGQRKLFDIKINPEGTKFQKTVWKKLYTIPYGKTVSYLKLANRLNTSPRAIGNACGKNPLLIVIPCHRVLSIKKELTGFSALGGIITKKKLLKIENIKI